MSEQKHPLRPRLPVSGARWALLPRRLLAPTSGRTVMTALRPRLRAQPGRGYGDRDDALGPGPQHTDEGDMLWRLRTKERWRVGRVHASDSGQRGDLGHQVSVPGAEGGDAAPHLIQMSLSVPRAGSLLGGSGSCKPDPNPGGGAPSRGDVHGGGLSQETVWCPPRPLPRRKPARSSRAAQLVPGPG